MRFLGRSVFGFGAVALLPVLSQGQILIDDFTVTGADSPFPAVAEVEFPALIEQIEDVFETDLGPLGRAILFEPLLATDQAIEEQASPGSIEGTQTISLDTAAGRLTTTSTGSGSPLFLLAYAAGVEGTTLDLDVSGEAGVFIRYETNLDVNVDVVLSNNDTSGNLLSGNETTVVFESGASSIFIPFEQIDIALTELDFSGGFPATEIVLPNIALESLDGLALIIDPISDVTVPEGLVFSLDSIAFVPEPASAFLLWLGAMGLMGRRQR